MRGVRPSDPGGQIVKRRKDRHQTQEVRGKEISITGEAEYIVARAMVEDARIVSIPPLVFLSTTTGDAWVLDGEDSQPSRWLQRRPAWRSRSSRHRSASP
jgi:hypothetical protein